MQSILITLKLLVSFYSNSIVDAHGDTIHFSSFANKKVLIVNTSVTTADTAQYGKLEQVYQKYKDSLVIIAFPSDDFGHAGMDIDSISSFVSSHYNIHYILASKVSVKGIGISPIYSWLADITKNGMMDSEVKSDYYKYLINKDGMLVGIFSRSVDPAGIKLESAVEQL